MPPLYPAVFEAIIIGIRLTQSLKLPDPLVQQHILSKPHPPRHFVATAAPAITNLELQLPHLPVPVYLFRRLRGYMEQLPIRRRGTPTGLKKVPRRLSPLPGTLIENKVITSSATLQDQDLNISFRTGNAFQEFDIPPLAARQVFAGLNPEYHHEVFRYLLGLHQTLTGPSNRMFGD